MLYIQDSDGDTWLDVVELLSEREDHDMVLCLHPGSAGDALPDPFSLPVAPLILERVTTYPDGAEPPCSSRVRVSAELVDLLRPRASEFEDWGDSLALYPLKEWGWAAALIPHQRVILVRDEQLHGFLDAVGIPVNYEAPDGWQSDV